MGVVRDVMMKILMVLSIGMLIGKTVFAIEGEELAKKQCRSVHLGYQADYKDAHAAYAEIEVRKSSVGTYFCALGFNKGYIGMQELTDGKKVVIFSVWEPNHGENPKNVPDEVRAELIRKGEGVRVGRFGGEGTGGQSFYNYDWKVGEKVRFLVRAEPVGKLATKYTGWFFDNQRKSWQLMTEFKTPTKGEYLGGGVHSFIEDFRRNYESAKVSRMALYKNQWVLNEDEKWVRVIDAKFTADATPSLKIDAGNLDGGFFLKTGGDTKMETTKLWDLIRGKDEEGSFPDDVKAVLE